MMRKEHTGTPEKHRKALISLSLLEYEEELSKRIGDLKDSEVFSRILKLVDSGMLYSLHIDVMRPPLIPDRSAFPTEVIRDLYVHLHDKIMLVIHLMVKEPDYLIKEIDSFIELDARPNISLIIHREAYASEEDVIKRLKFIKELGYKAGIGLNLPTPLTSLTDGMIKNADMVLIMSVPMGKGGQRYDDRSSRRIRGVSERFPDKLIEVDGGINDETIRSVVEAGAKSLVIGSYVTKNTNPIEALVRLHKILSEE
ncbi:MAG: hypothetical protein ACE5NN_05350 [Candidatus Bathyarchaeia archaeon]